MSTAFFSATYAEARAKFLRACGERGLPVEHRVHPGARPRGRGAGDRRRPHRSRGPPAMCSSPCPPPRRRGFLRIGRADRRAPLGPLRRHARGRGGRPDPRHQPPWLLVAAPGHPGERRPQPQSRRPRPALPREPGLRGVEGRDLPRGMGPTSPAPPRARRSTPMPAGTARWRSRARSPAASTAIPRACSSAATPRPGPPGSWPPSWPGTRPRPATSPSSTTTPASVPTGTASSSRTTPSRRPGHGRLVSWLGADQVTSTDDGSSASAPLTGVNGLCVAASAPHATLTMVTPEFGTSPSMRRSIRCAPTAGSTTTASSTPGRAAPSRPRSGAASIPTPTTGRPWCGGRASDTERKTIAGLATLG